MFYIYIRKFFRVVLFLLRRWEVHGLSNLPERGGMIIVSNHSSYWDPIVVGCAITRRVNYLAKEELFRIPVFRNIITAMAAFPVKRHQSDRTAIRKTLQFLANGEVVGIFPEGRRNHTGELMEAELGAAMLALKAGVPIMPIGLIGTRGVFNKVKVNIGEPILYQVDKKKTREDMVRISKSIMVQIDNLLTDSKNNLQ
jgi:1-acyl-sn-glycerol-3-phosphate acyltransferase